MSQTMKYVAVGFGCFLLGGGIATAVFMLNPELATGEEKKALPASGATTAAK